MTDRNQATIERAERLVRQEVHMCLSSLVHTLAQSYGLVEQRSAQWVDRREVKERVEALTSLQGQALDMSSPVLDYEEAAQQAGLQVRHDIEGFYCCTEEEAEQEDAGNPSAGFDGRSHYLNMSGIWEDICREREIDPYEWEIFEHWAVSEWFGRQLAAQGERVDFDFAGMVVWGRTTTGQGIAMDAVVLKIAAKLTVGV